MLSKLTRILLALVTAVVFTGQMEAAAEHCARLAHEAQASQSPPCHEAGAANSVHADAGHADARHTDSSSDAYSPPDKTGTRTTHHPAPHAADHCECVAALNGCTTLAGALMTSQTTPYDWLPPQIARFVSSRPDPDIRPPRA